MSNMSYCRFQNTSLDLSDCKDALEEMISEGEGKLSREELRAAKRLIEHCINTISIVADYAGIDLNDEDGLHDFERNYEDALSKLNEEAKGD